MSSYKDLRVWQKSFSLCVDVYAITKLFPKEEQYGLTSQIRRSAVSIPSNIAEGSKRGKKEFFHFLRIAHGSGAELETQLLLAEQFGYIPHSSLLPLMQNLDEVMKMTATLIKKLES